MTSEEQTRWDRLEKLRSLDPFVEENLAFLVPTDRIWQPTDLLPDLCGDNWQADVAAFRDSAQRVSDAVLVVLVGDMVTEEALPSYAVSLNAIAQDYDGDAPTPWAKWLRGWTAEENRHGDLLNAYLRLSGRVDMRVIEATIHRLIARGFNPKTQGDSYKGLVYTSFQERATKISHANVSQLAASEGDENLARICQRIAGDEGRHEAFYTKMMGRVFDMDPEGGIIAFRDMLRSMIAMPGRLMEDGSDPTLFDHFAVVAQRLGVYTIHDYGAILGHLVKTWDIAHRSVSDKAAKAQEYLCRQSDRYALIGDEIAARTESHPPVPFKWIFDRTA